MMTLIFHCTELLLSLYRAATVVAAETIVTPGLAFSVMVGLPTNFNEVEVRGGGGGGRVNL